VTQTTALSITRFARDQSLLSLAGAGLKRGGAVDITVNPYEYDSSMILIGASIRSLAETALEAGLNPRCIDFFRDSDLTRLLQQAGAEPPIQISSFSEAPEVVSRMPPHLPVVWTGGLENMPAVMSKIASQRHVCGAIPEVVAHINNPRHLQFFVDGTTCRTPEIIWENGPNLSKKWLIKPTYGAGGIGIRPFQQGGMLQPNEFFQQHVGGVPVSALYCHGKNGTELLTTSLQLTGIPELGGASMAFCGNIGPVSLPAQVLQSMTDVGQRAASAGLTGVFGADFMVSKDDLWLIEVNPRITASHEIYDILHDGPSVLERHIDECCGLPPDVAHPRRRISGNACLARLVVYASVAIQLKESDIQQLTAFQKLPGGSANSSASTTVTGSWISDIPTARKIEAGEPFCSVYHVLNPNDNGRFFESTNPGDARIDSLIRKYTNLQSLDTIKTALQWLSHLASELPSLRASQTTKY
jgi:uncharacterized protein